MKTAPFLLRALCAAVVLLSLAACGGGGTADVPVAAAAVQLRCAP